MCVTLHGLDECPSMEINHQAPAVAGAEAIVVAPLDVVGSVQTRIDEWSRWNPDVSQADLRGPLMIGTKSHGKAGGVRISSVLQEVEPRRCVTWTGRTPGIRSIHAWPFTETDKGVLGRPE